MKDVPMVSTSALALAPCFTMSQACRFNREPVDRMIGQLGNVPDSFYHVLWLPTTGPDTSSIPAHVYLGISPEISSVST